MRTKSLPLLFFETVVWVNRFWQIKVREKRDSLCLSRRGAGKSLRIKRTMRTNCPSAPAFFEMAVLFDRLCQIKVRGKRDKRDKPFTFLNAGLRAIWFAVYIDSVRRENG